MRLEEFLNRIEPQRVRAIRDRLERLRAAPERRAHAVAFENVWEETRLPEHAWDAFCEAIEAVPDDVGEIYSALKEWARTNDFTLAGPEVELPEDALYAHCKALKWFSHWLCEQGWAESQEQAEEELHRLVDRSNLNAQRRRLGAQRLAQYLMWATYNRSDPRRDPVSGLPNTCDEVRACLGLARTDMGLPLLVFCYSLPNGLRPHLPTLPSALAAENWSDYWRPSGVRAKAGLTRPWEESKEKPRPEVVHKPVTGDALRSRIVRRDPPAGLSRGR